MKVADAGLQAVDCWLVVRVVPYEAAQILVRKESNEFEPKIHWSKMH